MIRCGVRVLVPVIMLSALTACASDDSRDRVTASPSFTDSIDSLESLRAAYLDAGGTCDVDEELDMAHLSGVGTICDEVAILGYFSDPAGREALTRSLKEDGFDVLFGDNWLLSGIDAEIVAMAKAGGLDGSILRGVRAAATESAATPSAQAIPTQDPGVPISFECRRPGDSSVGAKRPFSSMEEVWASGEELLCSGNATIGQMNDLQRDALEHSGYDPDDVWAPDELDALASVYSYCANTFIELDGRWPIRGDQALTAEAALMLCPEHPLRTQYEQNIENAYAFEQQVAEKRYIPGDGNYVIGSDLMPGTYRTIGDKAMDCYWEIADSNGNIIDNNFVTFAPNITVTIPASATSFTAQGCPAWDLVK